MVCLANSSIWVHHVVQQLNRNAYPQLWCNTFCLSTMKPNLRNQCIMIFGFFLLENEPNKALYAPAVSPNHKVPTKDSTDAELTHLEVLTDGSFCFSMINRFRSIVTTGLGGYLPKWSTVYRSWINPSIVLDRYYKIYCIFFQTISYDTFSIFFI